MGGLGNQLFQIFATLAYAHKHGRDFYFLNQTHLGHPPGMVRPTNWETLFHSLKPFLVNCDSNANTNHKAFRYRELNFSFHEIPPLAHGTVVLQGYFQSYQYFQEEAETIYHLLHLSDIRQGVLSRYTQVNPANSISMHFRRGDYKTLKDCYPLATVDYYREAMCRLKDSGCNTVLYFCEDDDLPEVQEMVDELQIAFGSLSFVRCDPLLADWEQLLVMSACRHNIIANSSFSWWGAYLNTHPDKKVCYPAHWFGPKLPHDISDLCPLEWIRIESV